MYILQIINLCRKKVAISVIFKKTAQSNTRPIWSPWKSSAWSYLYFTLYNSRGLTSHLCMALILYKFTLEHSFVYKLWTGLPDDRFSNQKPNSGKFWRIFQLKMLIYFMDIWSILRPNGICMPVWYIWWSFGIVFPILVCYTKIYIWQPWQWTGMLVHTWYFNSL
jgi:hypothetical protein